MGIRYARRWVVGLVGLLLGACDSGPPLDGRCDARQDRATAAETCPCTAEGCPPGLCGVQISLSVDCEDVCPVAEVFFAGCLLWEELAAGGVLIPCQTLAAGTEGTLVVRGARHQWGPFDLSCPPEGGLVPVVLSCR